MLQFQQSSTGTLPFFLTLASDHITGATSITPAVFLSKNGGPFSSASGTVVEMAYGWYGLRANAVDLNTLGSLSLHASGATCDPDDRTFEVIGYNIFGSGINSNIIGLLGSPVSSVSGIIDANVVRVQGSGVTSVSGNLNVNLVSVNGASVSSVTGTIDANIVKVLGSGVTATTGVLFVQSNVPATVTGIVSANVTQWNSVAVRVPSTTGIPDVNVFKTANVTVPAGGLASSGNANAIFGETQTIIADIATETGDIQSRLPAALVSGRMDASVGAMTAGVISSGVIASGSLQTISDGIFNSALDNTMTAKQFLRALGALAAGQATGGGTSTITFKALNDGATTRITATVDGSGNRSSVTLNL